MAEVLLHKIQFIQNNQFGTFVAGDLLEVYIDDLAIVTNPYPLTFQSVGVVTYLNGSVITSGPFISSGVDFTTISKQNTKICNGTELVVTDVYSLFPYAFYYTLADHFSCAVNADTCDLIAVGNPIVTPASASDAADGEIEIIADSSYSIEYYLGNDFTYGNGQASGSFTNLLPGSYRIFIRDEKNCGVNVLVELPYSNTFGVKYRLEYYDLAGFHTKIDIGQRGYSGDVNEICGTDNPFEIQLRGEGNTYKFEPILATQANVNLTSETNQYFIDLYTNDPNLFRVYYYKDTGSGYSLKWTGKLLPFIYSEEYKAPPYYVTAVASDGLPELKDFLLMQKDGAKFTGKMSLIKLIAFCLSKLKLDLSIRIACNLYSTDMAQTDADDPFDQAYIDVECFYLADKDPSLDFVLKSILEPFGARLVQWDNYWNIVRVEEMTYLYDYRQFDSLGDYVSEGSINPVIDIEFPSEDGIMFNGFPNLELQKGYGSIRVNFKLGLKENLIRNGDFGLTLKYIENTGFSTQPNAPGFYQAVLNTEGFTLVNSDYPIFEDYEVIENGNVAWRLSTDDQIFTSQNSGEAYVQTANYFLAMGVNNTLKIKIRYKIGRSTSSFLLPYGITFPYVKVRVMVRYGNLYLQQSGTWTLQETTIDFYVDKLNEFLESEVIANQPDYGAPFDGENLNIRVYHATSYYTKFHSLTALRAFVTFISSGTASGTDTYATTISGAAYTTGKQYAVTFTNANTGASTINISTLGAKALKKAGAALVAGDILAGVSYIIYYDGTNFEMLRVGAGGQAIPVGFRTELRDSFTLSTSYIYYYEFTAFTSAASSYDIVRPDDYHAVNNPRQWVLKQRRALIGSQLLERLTFSLDKVEMDFLADGKDPIDAIIRIGQAEPNNKDILEKTFIIGSIGTVVKSEGFPYYSYFQGIIPSNIFGIEYGGQTVQASNVLPAALLYTGWLRDINDIPYEFWARDGISESDKLHGIWLKMAIAQYNASWSLLRAVMVSKTQLMGLLNSFKEVNDNDKIYIPISVTLKDKANEYSAELLEMTLTGLALAASGDDPGSDGSGVAPFQSGFSSGFGSDFD